MSTFLPVYRLAVYAPRSIDPAEATVLTPIGGAPHSDPFQVTTIGGVAGWKPYLVTPTGRRGKIDVRNKSTDTGVMTFELLDPQLPGTDPLARWFPAYLGNLQGQLRGGGLLCQAWESLDGGATFAPFFAGRLRTIQQVSPIRYALQIRELTDDLLALAFVGLPHADIYYAAFSSLLPVAGLSVPAAEKKVLTSSVANPSVITVATTFSGGHGYTTGDVVTIGGHAGSTPSINGTWTVTVTGPATFTIPVNVTVGGTGGTVSKYVLGTTTLYGKLPVVPPLTGTIQRALLVTPDRGMIVHLDNASRHRLDNIVTTNLMTATHLEPGGPPMFVRGTTGPAVVRVRRTATGQVGYFHCWLAFNAPTVAGLGLEAITPGTGDSEGGRHRRVLEIGISPLQTTEAGYMSLADFTLGETVEAIVLPDTQVSETCPLFIGDVHLVTLWRHLLEGKFGFRWTYPETLPSGVSYGDPRLPMPYDTAAFAALEADPTFPTVRFQITKRAPRGEWIRDNILKAGNLSFYLDGSGKVVPIDLRRSALIAAVGAAPTITDADLAQGAPKQWNYDRGQAITRVDAFYYGDVQITAAQKLNDDPTFFPTISASGLTEVEYPRTVLDLGNVDLGDAPLTLKLPGFRTMAGETLNGQDRRTYLERQVDTLALDTALPFGQGAPTIPLSCRRGSNGDAKQGQVRKISIRSVPDPATNKLGGTRVVRIVERAERKTWVDITVMDLGLSLTANVPTIGVPAVQPGNTLAGAQVPVTLNAAGDPVEVHYAVTATSVGSAPAAGSPLWTPIPQGLVRTTSTPAWGGLPTGQRIWVRGRTYPDARTSYQLPSAWVAASAPGYIDLFALSAPIAPASSLITARSFRVSWALAKNLVLWSEAIDNAYWIKTAATVSADATVAPDGTTTADKLVETAVNSAHNIDSAAITITSGEEISVFCCAKSAGRTQVKVLVFSGADSFEVRANLGAGTLATVTTGVGAFTTGATMTDVGNGWWLITAVGKVNGGHTTAALACHLDDGSHGAYLGDITKGAYFWGMQFERGVSTPSNYNKTTDGLDFEPYNRRGIEVLIATPTTDPRVVIARLPGGSTFFDFPGSTGLLIQPSTTYRVGLRHYTSSPASVSAEVTIDVATNTTEPVPDLPHPPRLFN